MMQTVWGGWGWVGGGVKVGNKVAIRMSVSWRRGRRGRRGRRKASRGHKRKRRVAVLTLEEKAGEAGQQEPQ